MKLITRDGHVEQVWKVEYQHKYFQWVILVRGTEPEMQRYVESEVGHVGGYHALTDSEVEAAKKLRMKIYIAPKLTNENRWR